MAPVEPEELDRLRLDTRFYAPRVIKIVDKAGRLVPLILRPSQEKVLAAIDRQRAAGVPVRVRILKSRKTGVSTVVQARALQRATLTPYQRCLVVAQDSATAGELWTIGERAYNNLPRQTLTLWDGRELELQPAIRNRRSAHSMWFGEPSPEARAEGRTGVDSVLRVDTAREVEAGRGFTYHFMHLSEIAFYPDVKKLIALRNSVPDEPNTEIIEESTANGANHFKKAWERSVAREDDYEPVFIGWMDDPDCWLAFVDDGDREEFAGTVGDVAEEVELVEEYGASLEQLHWRRWALANKCDGSLDVLHQEFPLTSEQAFLSTGKTVFDKALIARVYRETERTDPRYATAKLRGPDLGIFDGLKPVDRRGRHGVFPTPTEVAWRAKAITGLGERHPYWRLWSRPDPGLKLGAACPRCTAGGDEACDLCGGSMALKVERPKGAYVLAVDPASGEETESGENAWHGVTVIDHRSKVQVAEWRSRWDADQVALEALKAAMFWNDALVVVEISGGYGLSIVRRVSMDYGYPNVYMRRQEAHRKEPTSDRLGWDTNPGTKPMLEDRMRELLRTDSHGIRSALVAQEMSTYIKLNTRGRTGPDADAHSDLLMSLMIAQLTSTLVLPPTGRKPKTTSSTRRR